MASVNMLDIAKLTGNDRVLGLIEENLTAAPEVLLLPFRTIKGTSFKTGVRTGFPSTGFRRVNGGQTASKSTFAQKTIECFLLSGLVKADVAAAKAHEDGAEAFKMIEASGVMESSLIDAGAQIFYGTTTDALGFPGLKSHAVFGDTTAQGDALTINAGGTTSNTAASAYLIAAGERDVCLIGGNDSTFELGEWYKQLVTADDSSGEFEAWCAALTSWIGLQVPHENCVRRVCNLTDDSGKGLTDSLIARAMATFPTKKRPTHILCNRFQAAKLQQSRTVVLQGQGTNRPNQETVADLPTSAFGLPIIITDSIGNTDAIES